MFEKAQYDSTVLNWDHFLHWPMAAEVLRQTTRQASEAPQAGGGGEAARAQDHMGIYPLVN